MSFTSKLSLLALASGIAFSTSASATANAWDTATPWGSSALSEYAEWNTFTSTTNNPTPELGSNGTLTGTPGSMLFGGDIYTFNSIATFTATLDATSGIFDVYLRAATQGNMLAATATLNGVNATSVLAYNSNASQGIEQEVYWKWSNVTAGDFYTFQFSAAAPHVLLDQVSLSTVTAAVPEPETYAMMAAGLGLIGFMRRKHAQKRPTTA